MSKTNIIRAWKDAEYRDSLSEVELRNLPANPVGTVTASINSSEAFRTGILCLLTTDLSRGRCLAGDV